MRPVGFALSAIVAAAAVCIACAPAVAAPPAAAPRATAGQAAETSRAVANVQPPDPSSGGSASGLSAAHRTLTLEGAKVAIAGAVAEAHAKKTTGVVAVVDAGGSLVALERIDDTFAAGAMISIGKAKTAVLFKKPTRAFEDIIRSGRTPMITVAEVTSFTPLQGGVPIVVAGEVLGGIGVSGAASASQDEELALAGASALAAALGAPVPLQGAVNPVEREPSPPHEVVFFPHDKVREAFAKGTVLVENPGENYKVHASRREGPGLAEVHTRDADVIYVLEGTATLVTGGSVVDGKPIEPEEIRGTSVQGGEPHKLMKGDVLVVPRGIPHWFKETTNPFTYYVVKVRS